MSPETALEIDRKTCFYGQKGIFTAFFGYKASFSTFCVEKLRLSISSTKIVNINFAILVKFTQATLDKIEAVLDEAEYVLRYERR